MKKWIALLFLVFVASSCIQEKETKLQFGVKYRVLVLKVIDGDTIDVQLPNGVTESVRMLGVDTPEKVPQRNRPNEYDEITNLTCLAEWGVRAAEFTKSMLEGKHVYIELDRNAGMRGYYGRLLAYIYLENGTDFTAMLIKLGYARAYAEAKFEKRNHYIQLERIARDHFRGLWKCENIFLNYTEYKVNSQN